MSKPNTKPNAPPQSFKIDFKLAYSTFDANGVPPPIPYLVDGLLTEGGFSVLGAKPKQGKSSLARQLAVCVAKGQPFLGRPTKKGGVILVSLEDPLFHVDNHLKALGYDPRPEEDCGIVIVDKMAPELMSSLNALADLIRAFRNDPENPPVRLVIIDHLAKLLRTDDLNDYMPVLTGTEQIHKFSRYFGNIHVLAVAHCKKVKTDDPYDSFLGSTGIRGETDSNFAIYEADGQRLISSETRVGYPIQPSILHADIAEGADSCLVTNFSIGETHDEWKSRQTDRVVKGKRAALDLQIVEYLEAAGGTATQKDVLEAITGRDANIIQAIKQLVEENFISAAGSPRMLRLEMESDALAMYKLAFANGKG